MSISAISKSYDICRETIYKWMKAEQEGTLFEDYRKNLGQKTSIDHGTCDKF
jgi:transposase-like protein